MATCTQCGANFRRAVDESWKKLCFGCWKETRQRERNYFGLWQQAEAENDLLAARLESLEKQLSAPAPLERELCEQLPRLIQLAHPDRHGGSEASNRATAWLLSIKRALGARP